jgi:HK97 family phage major capsid protein
MKTLAELKAAYEKTILSLDLAKKMLTDAKDDASKALAQKAYDQTKTELAALEAEITARVAEDKSKAHIVAGLKDLETLNAAVPPTPTPETAGKGIADVPAKVDAVPADHFKSLLEREDLVCKWIGQQGRPLDGVAMAAIAPNARLAEKAITAGADVGSVVQLPPRIWAKMLGCDMQRVDLALKAIPMVTGDGSGSGGRSYLFWPEYDPVLKALPPEEPSLFQRVTKRPAVNGSYVYTSLATATNEYGSVAVSRGTEGSNANETEMEFTQSTITTYPMNAYTEASRILLGRDRIGLESELVKEFRLALERRINYEIMHGRGDASTECLGLRNDDDVILVSRGTAGAVDLDDLINVESGIRVALRVGASYCLADNVKQSLKKLKISSTTDQRPLFTTSNSIATGVADRLNEYPWFVGTDMNGLGGSGDVIFGNFANYTLAMEQDAVVSISDHYQFKKGLRCFRIDSMNGGRAILPTSFVVLVGTSGS